jgi:CPA2 family monovalent cation:H+ antiporter-2
MIDVDAAVTLETAPDDARACSHLGGVRSVTPSAPGCEECLALGDRWVHLRICMACGHVGCCDSSKNRHATRHHRESGHAIIRSLQPGEAWGWCYFDQAMLGAL